MIYKVQIGDDLIEVNEVTELYNNKRDKCWQGYLQGTFIGRYKKKEIAVKAMALLKWLAKHPKADLTKIVI